jgi:hypothetical protein
MLRRFPGTLRWRQALPPLFVLVVISFSILSIWIPWVRIMLLAGLLLYLALLLAASIPGACRNRDWRLMVGFPAAIVTMHFSWGAGFLWSALRSGLK